jgi:hypothetical protein
LDKVPLRAGFERERGGFKGCLCWTLFLPIPVFHPLNPPRSRSNPARRGSSNPQTTHHLNIEKTLSGILKKIATKALITLNRAKKKVYKLSGQMFFVCFLLTPAALLQVKGF